MDVASLENPLLFELRLCSQIQNCVLALALVDALEIFKGCFRVFDYFSFPLVKTESVITSNILVSYPEESFNSLFHLRLVSENKEVIFWFKQCSHVVRQWPSITHIVGSLYYPIIELFVTSSDI